MEDKLKTSDNFFVKKARTINPIIEKIGWKAVWTINKYKGDLIPGLAINPYGRLVEIGNLGMNAGIQVLEDLLIGSGTPQVYDNSNAYLGVGDDNTAENATQTDLIGSSKLRKAMEATFPSRSSQTISFKSIFGTSDANWHWQEYALFNASSSGEMLNRKVPGTDPGTKTSADTWTLTLELTVS